METVVTSAQAAVSPDDAIPTPAARPAVPPARGGTPRGAINGRKMFAAQWRVAFLTVVLPAMAFVAGLVYLLGAKVSLFYLGLWAVMHYVGMAGISVGYHRLASHQSFKGKSWARRALMIAGSMGAQGPVLYWATNHRRHHHMCDKAGDVHSPYVSEAGEAYTNAWGGWWQAHTGWMFRSHPTDPVRYGLDLLKDQDAIFANRHYYKWVTLGIVLPGVVSAAVFQTWGSFFLGMLIGGAMRIFTVQHVTWAINSLTHMFGAQPYANEDRSSNLLWLSIPTAGESWHNNHHAFPYSARLGLEWWELDSGWWLLVAMRSLGFVWDLKLPSAESKAARRRDTAMPTS